MTSQFNGNFNSRCLWNKTWYRQSVCAALIVSTSLSFAVRTQLQCYFSFYPETFTKSEALWKPSGYCWPTDCVPSVYCTVCVCVMWFRADNKLRSSSEVPAAWRNSERDGRNEATDGQDTELSHLWKLHTAQCISTVLSAAYFEILNPPPPV